MLGAECMADMLEAYGVTHVFHVPAVLRKTFAVMETRTKIKRLHVHSEATAAYMADGYARASGKPGICMAQVIGALNLAAGLRDAWLAHSPVIAFTGGREPKTKFRQVYQEVDDVPAFEPVTKWNATVDDVTRFPDMVRQAFRAATTGRPGPVHLQFPRQRRPGRRRRRRDGAADRTGVFARAAVSAGAGPGERAGGAEGAQEAQRPVIVAGGGVRASGAARELWPRRGAANPGRDFAQRQGLDPGQSSAVMRRRRHLFAREREQGGQCGRSRLLCRHDDRRHDHTLLGGAEDRHPAIQIDIDPEALGLNYPLQARVNGDAKVTLAKMLAAADKSSAGKRKAWVEQAQGICKEWYAKYKPMLESDAVPINPARICHELSKHVPDDAIVVVDTGHAGMWMGGMYDLRTPTQSYIRSAGHLGWAFPAGLGAKCGAPDRPW